MRFGGPELCWKRCEKYDLLHSKGGFGITLKLPTPSGYLWSSATSNVMFSLSNDCIVWYNLLCSEAWNVKSIGGKSRQMNTVKISLFFIVIRAYKCHSSERYDLSAKTTIWNFQVRLYYIFLKYIIILMCLLTLDD